MIGRRSFVASAGFTLAGILLQSRVAKAQGLLSTQTPESKSFNTSGILPVEIRLTPSIAWDFDAFGNRYSLDKVNNLLTKYVEGKVQWQIGGSNVNDFRRLNLPSSVVTDRQGRVYVTDLGNSRVLILSESKGQLINVIRSTRRKRLNSPQDLAVANGKIYVADTLSHEIDIYTVNGRHVTTFGTHGNLYNQLNGPTSIAVADNSDIFVVDNGNFGIKVFSQSGVLLDIFDDKKLDGIKNFRPSYITMGPEGILYAADSIAGRVIVMTQKGRVLDVIELIQDDGSRAQPRYLGISPNGSLVVSAFTALPQFQQKSVITN